MKKDNDKVLKRILKYTKPYGHLLLFALLFTIASVSMTLYAPVLVGKGVDLIVSEGNVDFEGLYPLLIRLGIVIALASLSRWLAERCTNKVSHNTARDIRIQAFKRLHILPLKYIDSGRHGDFLSRVITDVNQVSDGLLMGFSQLFNGIITIIGTIVFMLSMDFRITVIVVLVTPLSLFVANFVAKNTYHMFKLRSETMGELTSLVEEMTGNLKTVKAFGYEKEAQKRFEEINSRLRKHGLRAVFFSSITNPCTRFVNGVVYTSVGIAGALLAIKGAISVGQLSAFLNYANQYTKPFNEISGVIAELQSAFASAKRVFDIIDEEPQTPDPEDAVCLDRPDGSVVIKDVSFSYRPDIKLIENLNLTVKPGQRIAIVGPTGSGKTTVINLLMRFYDVDKGEIIVSGYPVKKIKRDSLRSAYGMVLQDTWLKTGTVRENIAYGKPDATDEEIENAAKAARADSFIRRLPKGYDTLVSDNDKISEGEKQLLSIARVMLTSPPMLILDEATSSVDTRTEINIQKAFDKMMEGRTSFVVAHRLSTIREADCILVMNKGKIVEQGTHEELLKKEGFYANLYYSQFDI
ncbi:MAG: ABC transporter ATP-binding protein [Clostridia bacterium]|jgi:ATP-binding cassette subfamily B multidrug efflux pump|nr:ABC transporter ATP-binding protein [Clostridiaceae bacterium]